MGVDVRFAIGIGIGWSDWRNQGVSANFTTSYDEFLQRSQRQVALAREMSRTAREMNRTARQMIDKAVEMRRRQRPLP